MLTTIVFKTSSHMVNLADLSKSLGFTETPSRSAINTPMLLVTKMIDLRHKVVLGNADLQNRGLNSAVMIFMMNNDLRLEADPEIPRDLLIQTAVVAQVTMVHLVMETTLPDPVPHQSLLPMAMAAVNMMNMGIRERLHKRTSDRLKEGNFPIPHGTRT